MDEKPKKGPGRPRVRPENAVNIRCELSPEEHKLVIEAADFLGKPVGALAREAVVDLARKALKRKEEKRGQNDA